MSTSEFTEVPYTIGCKIPQGIGDYDRMEPFPIGEQ